MCGGATGGGGRFSFIVNELSTAFCEISAISQIFLLKV